MNKKISKLIASLVEHFRVILFLDFYGKEKAQWVKHTLINDQQLLFDAVYTYNTEEMIPIDDNTKLFISSSVLDLSQIVRDFIDEQLTSLED